MRLSIPFRRTRHPVAGIIVWLLITFLVLFPKGGFKIGFVPITWGYLILALFTVPLVIVRLLAFPLNLPTRLLPGFFCILPFQAIFVYAVLANGIAEPAIFVSSVVAFFYLPWMFLLVFPWFFDRLNVEKLSRHLRFSILAAALFGIFLFFYHPIAGSFIEIPYLTVNSGDYGELELHKHIQRGSFFKLISTYNNGNLYGTATLILLPLYNLLEPRRWKRYVLVAALTLTLSRTVWAGLVLNELFTLFSVLGRSFKHFPRVVLGPAVKAGIALLATVAAVFAGLLLNFNSKVSFLFDSELGGRGGQLAFFIHPDWVPQRPVGGFGEIVYASAVATFGVFGLIAIILLFISPLLLYFFWPQRYNSPFQKAALQGLMLYALLAGSDGAINLIPVIVFYWFVYMIFIFDWPTAGTWHPLALVLPLISHRSTPLTPGVTIPGGNA